MTIEIISLPDTGQAPVQLPNVTAFVEKLCHFTKTSIVNTGIDLLWKIFKDKKNYTKEQIQIVNAYGPKLITLGLATASDCRGENLNTNGFYELCNDYNSIRDSISSQAFLKKEAKKILNLLQQESSKEKTIIPDKYLKYKYIRPCCSVFFISRMVRAQHEMHLTNINELYTAYQLLILLDQYTNNMVTSIFRKIFNIDILHFFRSGFGLFAMANNKYGHLDFKILGCDEQINKKLVIDIDTCRLVASKISIDESKLKEVWYKKEMFAVDEIYQKHIPSPLSNHPIVHMDIKDKNNKFLIASPSIFIRGFSNFILSQLFQYDRENSGEIGLAPKLGDIFEAHVHTALDNIFGVENVNKIKGEDERADFYIELNDCDIIIEVKTGLGTYQSQSLMTPEHVADIWSRLYKACKQCSNSIKHYKKSLKPIIAIILIGNHITTAEAMPFYVFAEQAGLLEDLNIQSLEILSWNALEYTLSKTSVCKFTTTLLKKWSDRGKMHLEDLMSLEIERDTPAHSYEYLQETVLEIFGKHFKH